MNKVIAVFAVVVVLFGLFLATQSVYSSEKSDLHLIIFAQDPETEVEIQVDSNKKKKVILNAGVNYVTYKTIDKEVSVWAYGDKITPRIDKGMDNDYYTIVCVTPPGESVGE